MPLFNFLETDEVGSETAGINLLIKLVLPTPEGPARTVNLVFLNLSINNSIPSAFFMDTGTQSYPQLFILFIFEIKSFFEIKSTLVKTIKGVIFADSTVNKKNGLFAPYQIEAHRLKCK